MLFFIGSGLGSKVVENLRLIRCFFVERCYDGVVGEEIFSVKEIVKEIVIIFF